MTGRPRLSALTVGPLTAPRPEQVRMVHLGVGAFARAHVLAMTEDAGGGWGVTGVAPRRAAAVEELAPQDGLYTLVERGPAGDDFRLVGVLREVLGAAADPDAVVRRLADPGVAVVTLTITEAAYAPGGILALLARALRRRMRADAPLTVVSCDNVPRNGQVLGELVRRECDQALREWVDARVTFPSTVVDRIVPATVDADRAAVAEALGVDDRAAVVGEPYRSWVIEDAFASDRPPWEAAGALLVADSGPHEALKLRVLNGSHSLLAHVGLLAGLRTVDEAVGTDWLAAAVRRLVDEDVGPTLAPVPGVDLDAHLESLFERWSNPRIAHGLEQIATDAEHKLALRLAPSARERHEAGAEPRWIALVVAAWALGAGHDARAASGELDLPAPVEELVDGWMRAIAAAGVARAVYDALGDG